MFNGVKNLDLIYNWRQIILILHKCPLPQAQRDQFPIWSYFRMRLASSSVLILFVLPNGVKHPPPPIDGKFLTVHFNWLISECWGLRLIEVFSPGYCCEWTYDSNKKVLLRERKRHISSRAESGRSADLSTGGGGYPHPVPMGGVYPIQSWLGGGYPIQSQLGGYPHPVPTGGVPWGSPINQMGIPPSIRKDGGTPRCGQTHRRVSKHYLPVVLRTRAVNIM